MSDNASHNPTPAMSDGRSDPEQQTEEERIFFNEVSIWKLPPQAQA